MKTAKGLPLLDSFLKESARVSAFDSSMSHPPHFPNHFITLPPSMPHAFSAQGSQLIREVFLCSYHEKTSIAAFYVLRRSENRYW